MTFKSTRHELRLPPMSSEQAAWMAAEQTEYDLRVRFASAMSVEERLDKETGESIYTPVITWHAVTKETEIKTEELPSVG